ncbi:MAG TPA: hypothetical protein PKA95_12320 [Thermomicrobiales bacterium]|nr:hypothetical protein [Thermomicrobiales bacterium]
MSSQSTKGKAKRLLEEQARQVAADGDWTAAVEVNKEIIERSPRDAAAFNRLGKAYFEMRRFRSAYEAYQQAFSLDPANVIAQRNISRLEPLKDTEAEVEATGRTRNLRAGIFVEEIGKTYVDDLVAVAPADVLTELSSGDQLTMQIEGDTIRCYDEDGEYIGQFEPRLARRIIDLTSLSNEYAVYVTANTGQSVRVIIRETQKSPEMGARLSFPRQGKISIPRAYLRDTRLFRDEPDLLLGDEEDEELDTEDAEEFEGRETEGDEDDTEYIEETTGPAEEDETI